MTRSELIASIKTDLGANYNSDDDALLEQITKEMIMDALYISNRMHKASEADSEAYCTQLDVLAPDVRKAVKSVYLIRGGEDASSQSMSGISVSFQNAVDVMTKDIVRSGKRILR